MWTHLIKCLEARKMEPFPQAENDEAEKGQIKKNVVYPVHCVCRRRKKGKEVMKQCGSCSEFFHPKCLKLPKNGNVVNAVIDYYNRS